MREARIACAVKHRNVIQTMDFGQTDDGRAYMVMELLHGEELTERIDTEPRLTLDEMLKIVGDVLRGLSAIHDAGIVHRDLKPENIYLERDQEGIYPKILDFGIAKSIDRTRGQSRRSVLTTKEGLVVGTPEYMPPEQARGVRDLDARADVWSVGVILFELLTGKLPFDEPSEVEVIIKVVTTDAPKAIELNPEVPKGLSDLVAKALRRERSERYQTAAEMLQALQEADARDREHNASRRARGTTPTPRRGVVRNRRRRRADRDDAAARARARARAYRRARQARDGDASSCTASPTLPSCSSTASLRAAPRSASERRPLAPDRGPSQRPPALARHASCRQQRRLRSAHAVDGANHAPTASAASAQPVPALAPKPEPRRPRSADKPTAPRAQPKPAAPAPATGAPDKKAPTLWRNLDF